jgi:threonine dehydrogenase-like Zn-dependent dehydrogenase
MSTEHAGSADMARAVLYEGPEVFSMTELPLPEVGPDEALLEVLLAGVDGSELHMFRGELAMFNERAPLIFGDEIVGRVVAIGERAKASRGLDVGDVVTVESRWPCAEGCRNCDRGQYFICRNNPGNRGYGAIPVSDGSGLWGGYASHVFVPAGALTYRIPDGLPLRAALFACSVLANGLRWSTLSGASEGKTVVVVGPGPQGLACVLSSLRAGATVVAVGLDRDTERLAVTERLGAKTVSIPEGEGYVDTAKRIRDLVGDVDIVIETAGFASARALAFEVVSSMGTVTNVAVPTPLTQAINWQDLLQREITVLNPISHPHTVQESLDLALAMYEDGLDLGEFVTHELPLERAADAIAIASYKTGESPIKVVLDPALRA